MAIHEALFFTREVREIIVRSGIEVDEEAIRQQARKDGTFNLREAGFEKVKLGLTSLQEVMATTTED
jgi:type IV pilus assembly protein PilB